MTKSATVLIAYATGEGQTAKIAAALAARLDEQGHTTLTADLAQRAEWPDPADFDGVFLAASVHGGAHQAEARDFILAHRETLEGRVTAFASVSLAAMSDTEAGQQRAEEQTDAFLRATEWRPGQVDRLAGAFRFSRFSALWRWIIGASQRIFGKALRTEGWPDLTQDEEFTDWKAVRDAADRFAARLG